MRPRAAWLAALALLAAPAPAHAAGYARQASRGDALAPRTFALPSALPRSAAPLAPGATFGVVDAGDAGDTSAGDGHCDSDSQAAGDQCTLRAALMESNALAGADTITFAIGAGAVTISPQSMLPVVTDPVTIDGTTQPGFVGSPLVELDGSGAGATAEGLRITAGSSTVRGLVINRFDITGLSLWNVGGNTIAGNYIGTDVTGSLPRGNGVPGGTQDSAASSGLIVYRSPGNLIGGTTAADRNVISGNLLNGVDILGTGATGNVIQGNYIGTDATGTAAVPNAARGVFLTTEVAGGGASGTKVLDNLVSGNARSGIYTYSISGVTIAGNLIGTTASGTAALGNERYGMYIETTAGTIVGGATAAARNVVSGNLQGGIAIEGASTGVTVSANHVGTDITGSAAIPNTLEGVTVQGTPEGNPSQTVVGGSVLGQGNVISANTLDGVHVLDGAAATRIEGNRIGTDAAGTADLGNVRDGVSIDANATGTVVGFGKADTPGTGTTLCDAGPCNVIAFNRGAGVKAGGTGATVRANRMFGNRGLAIDAAAAGVTPNDAGDANATLNFPVGVVATREPANSGWFAHPGALVVSGRLTSPNPAALTVDVYGMTPADLTTAAPRRHGPATYGTGRRYLGKATVKADGSFTLPLAPADAVAYATYTATVTNAAGTTSEASAACDPGDADGDGLCDDWETRGIDYDGNGTVDLPLQDYGADPEHKSIFIEVDSFPGHEPERAGLVDVIDAFDAAPLSNPDGVKGITLLLNAGPSATADPLEDETVAAADIPAELTGATWTELRDGTAGNACDGYFGTATDRAAPNCANILGARALVYRWALFADDMKVSPQSSGVSDAGGPNFIVSLGNWGPASIKFAGGRCVVQSDCQAAVEAGTFMHELGHGLGLGHGGIGDDNYKPNYLSVMNYGFQLRSSMPDRPLDYSRAALPTLDERHLDETKGLSGGLPASAVAGWHDTLRSYYNTGFAACKLEPEPTRGAIDWNLDGDGGHETDVSAAINDYTAGCDTAPGRTQTLAGYDDWSNLDFNLRVVDGDAIATSLAGTDPPGLSSEIAEDTAMTVDADRDGVVNGSDDCPATPNPGQADADADGIGDACLADIHDIDLSLAEAVAPGDVATGAPATFTVSVTNAWPIGAPGVKVSAPVPAGLELVSAQPSQGSYDAATGTWTAGTVARRATATLALHVRPLVAGTARSVAEISASQLPDVDSTPANGSPYEDDRAAATLTATGDPVSPTPTPTPTPTATATPTPTPTAAAAQPTPVPTATPSTGAGGVTSPPASRKRCRVPKLKGRTLAAAKKALKKRGCAAGKVRRRKVHGKKHGIVIAQSPKPGAVRPAKAKVKLVLSR